MASDAGLAEAALTIPREVLLRLIRATEAGLFAAGHWSSHFLRWREFGKHRIWAEREAAFASRHAVLAGAFERRFGHGEPTWPCSNPS